MDIIEDFGLYVVRAFGLLAQWLGDLTAPVPWVIVMAAAALPLLFIANFIIWILRGVAWPVRCKHPATTVRHNGDNACRMWVAGEWSYCRHHNVYKEKNSSGRQVDPNLPRWKTLERNQVVDRDDIRGINKSVSLLFYHGYARKPSQALNAIPEIVSELKTNINVMVARIKRQPVTEVATPEAINLTKTGPSDAEREEYGAFHDRAERADQALFILKWILPAAFVMTATSSFIKGPWTVFLEYFALLLIWIVVEIVRKGLLQSSGERDWRIQTFLGTLKGFGLIAGVAIICALLDGFVMPFIETLAT